MSADILDGGQKEIWNMAIDKAVKAIGTRYGHLLASGIERTNPEQWAAVSIEIYSLMETIQKLKKP